jgi:hypothetical protein
MATQSVPLLSKNIPFTFISYSLNIYYFVFAVIIIRTITINIITAMMDGLSEDPQSSQSHLSGIAALTLLDRNRAISTKFK